MKRFFKRRLLLIYLGSLVFIFVAVVAFTYFSNLRRERNYPKIHVGDPKATVVSLLGQPSEVTTNVGFLFVDHREHWCYGPQFVPHRPFINIRIFGPSDEDFVLIFSGEKVVEIKKPKN